MKKRMSIALALLLSVILLLAACAPSEPVETEPPGSEPGTSEPAGEKTTINFAVQADSTPALDALIEAFNEQSDKYVAEATIMSNDSGQMHDQLLNSLSAQS
ncbi:MAG: hypothetical protein PHR78_03035, partial [Eubacteriales bacterium]|nr:hypothetical protein [Eubacteriales bacterium]